MESSDPATNPRKYLSSPMDLLNMLNDPTTSDFDIVVNERVFKVHRVILQARSKYFAALFSSKNRETETGRMEIKEMDEDQVSVVLRFIYGAKLPDPSVVTLELYQIADMYRLIDLKYYCINVLASSLDSTNIICFLQHAEHFQDDRLMDVGVCYVTKNLDRLLRTEIADQLLDWKQLVKRILHYQNERLSAEA
ncbi:unnamed protein product [Bursaphelenchus xylophilus]|uniref:(pine wood nematode) hypothetical protein n=1 Tax=Bursaphelenchus xylophilus TaxID=6326 RepID=A0A1I7RWF1_BURXY|nr:unnamed protein product [Bursaphelenchus xylophilus]CAG9128303.1 unnamed protein product [Bursaphelenchus xylophilus]